MMLEPVLTGVVGVEDLRDVLVGFPVAVLNDLQVVQCLFVIDVLAYLGLAGSDKDAAQLFG